MAQRVEGGWTWKQVESTHTRGTNQHAAHQTGQQHDIALHGARGVFAISLAWLVLLQFCVYIAESLYVCCSCAALCVRALMVRLLYSCVCSTRAPSEVSSAVERCSR